MWNLYEVAMLLKPIIEHNLEELGTYNIRTIHVLYETAIMSYLVAMGLTPAMAIRTYERWEEMYGKPYVFEEEGEYVYRY